MVCKEEITLWFKGLEGDQRVDLMCNLLDCCLPLELRFLGTYIEFAASKHYGNLQKYEKTANEATFGELRDLYDATIRRKFCIYLALLYSHNKKAATDLFQFLEHFQLTGDKSKQKEDNLTVNGVICGDDETCMNEIKLLLSMASFHPAFTFNQKQILRNKLHSRPSSSPNLQSRDQVGEGLKKSPKVAAKLNELPFSSLSLSTANVTTTKMASASTTATTPDNRPSSLIDQYRYPAVPLQPLFSQPPSMSNMAFQSIPAGNIGNVQAIPPGSIAVFPTSPHSQVPHNLPHMLVKPNPVQGKAGGLAQGPNGIIHTIYPTPVYATTALPTSAPNATPNATEYRFSSAPIPVRPARVYGPLNQTNLNPMQQQAIHYNYNMSPYQSPMDSPLTSPFTSPSPSPKSSPLPSPRLSPFPSPVESPMFRKKFTGERSLSRRNSEQYASVYDWLKSLRLHKYADIFKDYTFDQMKDLSDEDLAQLGLTQGARKKFKLHINSLVEKGFKGFGKFPSSLTDHGSRPSSTGSYVETPRKASSSSDPKMIPVSSPGSTPRTFSASVGIESKYSSKESAEHDRSLEGNSQVKSLSSSKKSQEELRSELIRREQEHSGENLSDEGSQGTSESIDDLSDDEVFMTRRPTVIENKECPLVLASCYNCGSKDHFGEQCVEQNMEGETYQRYGYRLKYDNERLKEDRR